MMAHNYIIKYVQYVSMHDAEIQDQEEGNMKPFTDISLSLGFVLF